MPSKPNSHCEDEEQEAESSQLVTASVDGISASVDEISLFKKLHYYTLPFCIAVVILSYMDRGNLGFAANQLCHDLKLTHTEYGIGVSLFFIGYVIAHIPSTIMFKKVGVPVGLAVIMFTWGLIATCSSFVQNVYQFYTVRFLLGIAEAGSFPGVWYYLTIFYPDAYLTVPYAALEAAVAMSAPVSAPIAAGFISMDGTAGIRGWRVLFFFEGLVPMIIAPCIFFFMPRNPQTASFLTREEIQCIEEKKGPGKTGSSLLSDLKILSTKAGYWILVTASVLRMMLLTVVLYWTTLIIHHMVVPEDEHTKETCASSQSNGVKSIALTAVPYTISFACTLTLAKWTEKLTNRTNVTSLVTAASGIFLATWGITEKIGFAFGLLSLSFAITGINAPLPLLLGMTVSHFDAVTKSTAITVFNMVSSIGGLLGPLITGSLLDYYNNSYTVPLLIMGCIGLLGSIMIFTVRDPLSSKERNQC